MRLNRLMLPRLLRPLRMIDELVAVALPAEDHVVAAPFGLVDGILLVPQEQRTQVAKARLGPGGSPVDQLEVGRAAVAAFVAQIHVEQRAGQIASA